MKLKYSSLTELQKTKLTNGCGGKGMGFNPPQFFFKASCAHHDFYYWRGGNEFDRSEADTQFLKAMWSDANIPTNIFKRIWHKFGAFTYYSLVRVGGMFFFKYGPMKTEADLPKD